MLFVPLLPYLCVIAVFLGGAIGCVSSYSAVRRWSLLGDILSHASLPGIVYMFLFTHTKNISVLLLGGVLSAVCSSFISFFLQRKMLFAKDTPFAVVLSWFFSIGIIGLAIIQKKSIEGQSLINNFIFGNILMCSNKEFLWYVPLLFFIILFFLFTYRIQELLAFDYEYALLRYKWIKKFDWIILFFNIIVIVIGLQALGILLMGSLIIVPGVFARLLTNSYFRVMLLSIIISIIAFISGISISLYYTQLPTGPLIALTAIIGVMIYSCVYLIKMHYKNN